jgi:hypothetical protein
VLGEKREQVFLADTELPTKTIKMKFALLNPPANGLAGYANLEADFFYAEQTLIGGNDHDFDSCLQLARVMNRRSLMQWQLGVQAGSQKLGALAGSRNPVLIYKMGVTPDKRGSFRALAIHAALLVLWFDWSCQLRRRDYGDPKFLSYSFSYLGS